MNASDHQSERTLQLSAIGHLLLRAEAWLAAAARAARARRQRARDAAQLAELDDHALRDLGLSRSEFDSCRAEASAAAEHTRLRLAIVRAGGAAP